MKKDVEGAASVGIFPVWYEDGNVEYPWRDEDAGALPKCEHLHIHDWLELIDVLKTLE